MHKANGILCTVKAEGIPASELLSMSELMALAFTTEKDGGVAGIYDLEADMSAELQELRDGIGQQLTAAIMWNDGTVSVREVL